MKRSFVCLLVVFVLMPHNVVATQNEDGFNDTSSYSSSSSSSDQELIEGPDNGQSEHVIDVNEAQVSSRGKCDTNCWIFSLKITSLSIFGITMMLYAWRNYLTS